MLAYVLKRVLFFTPTLFGIVTVTFAIIQVLPGGPVEQAVAQLRRSGEAEGSGVQQRFERSSGLDPAQLETLKALYGFDKPWFERYLDWCRRLFTFDFGDSYFYQKSVIALFKEKLPVSASLGILSFLLTYLISIPLGVFRALREGSRFDVVSGVVTLVGYAIPGFVLGVFLMVFLCGGSFLKLFPLRGLVSDNFDELSRFSQLLDFGHHLFLPLVCMSIGSFAVLNTLTKNTILEHVKALYVLTARSKGLSEKVVIGKHVLRNAMIPLITGFAESFLTVLFTSSLLIETLFSLDGMGLLAYESVMRRDYPVVMASVFILAIMQVVGNLLSDVLYVWVDPRLTFEGR